jgi:hypothetical protein
LEHGFHWLSQKKRHFLREAMDEVVEWLNGLKLDRLLPVFKDAELETMDAILELTNDDMKELGVKLGPRKTLLKAIKAHKVWFVYCCCLSLKNVTLPPPQRRHPLLRCHHHQHQQHTYLRRTNWWDSTSTPTPLGRRFPTARFGG